MAKTFTLIVSLILVGILVGFAVGYFSPIKSCEFNLTYECENPQFVKIIENLDDEQTYREDYKCHQFAKQLVSRLKDAGYEASYCYGKVSWSESNTTIHAWVKVDNLYIESVSGEIIEPDKFNNNFSLINCYVDLNDLPESWS